ncbi:MAG TPA: hypothetical protein VEY08_16100, partial [Chloroflexia bacterium]|nr:hypothetical protein [Chloroflexia bacterium]
SDIKWDNCLVCSPPSRRGKPQFKLVDWELARVGDPCWDIGSAFCGYLNFWLNSVPMAAGGQPEQYLEMARYPLDKMQPAMRAFWLAYTQEMGLDAPTANEWLLRSARYAAARLVQEVFEQSQTSARLAGNVPYYLQVSLNMLQRPRDAVLHLLGIPSLQLSVL